jgi:hypothetical protein
VTFTYCGETDALTDAELVEIIRHLCGEKRKADDLTLSSLHLDATCDLEAGHPGAHASFAASGGGRDESIAWLRWKGAVRAVSWSAGLSCPWRADGTRDSREEVSEPGRCMLFEGHPAACCFPDENVWPSWCRSAEMERLIP